MTEATRRPYNYKLKTLPISQPANFSEGEEEEIVQQPEAYSYPTSLAEIGTNALFNALDAKAKSKPAKADTPAEGAKGEKELKYRAIAAKMQRLERFAGKASKISRKSLYSLKTWKIKGTDKYKAALTINHRPEGTKVTLTLLDIDKAIGSSFPAQKLFQYLLTKLDPRTIKNNEIVFPLQELVDRAGYSEIRTARTGFKQAMEVLSLFTVEGTLYKWNGDNNPIGAWNEEGEEEQKQPVKEISLKPFDGYKIERCVCSVFLNSRVNWSFWRREITTFPQWHFTLAAKPFKLEHKIFTLARNNLKKLVLSYREDLRAKLRKLNLEDKIKAEYGSLEDFFLDNGLEGGSKGAFRKKLRSPERFTEQELDNLLKDLKLTAKKPTAYGSFNINLGVIYNWLQLPSEKGNREIKKTIKEPIMDAIDDLCKAAAEAGESKIFIIEKHYNPEAPIKDFLSNGYITLKLSGKYIGFFLDTYAEMARRKAEGIKRAAEKKKKLEAAEA